VGDLTAGLWERYREQGDLRAREELLTRYLGLVHHCAGELLRRVPARVERDELLSAGTLGLVQALEGFEVGRGFAFSTYAVPRIRGAMLDELRSQDWLTRTGREHARDLERGRRVLRAKLGREPVAEDLAKELKIDLATCRQWLEECEERVFLPLDSPVGASDQEEHYLAETIPDPAAPVPGSVLERDDAERELRETLLELSPKDRLVIVLYYYEEMSLKQIGHLFHVTESRISQILSRGLRRLRERMAAMQQEEEV
jgi:RNA polymerase sigma factor FliA